MRQYLTTIKQSRSIQNILKHIIYEDVRMVI